MKKRILLVEDDPAIRMAIEDDLSFEGYSVDTAITGSEGLDKGLSRIHDLIILDLMLPGGADGLIHLDVGKQECFIGNKKIELSTLQASLLRIFLEHPGQVISRQEILDIVWGPEVLITPRTIDTHVGQLRKKIFTSDHPGNAIISIRGLGYKLIFDKNSQ